MYLVIKHCGRKECSQIIPKFLGKKGKIPSILSRENKTFFFLGQICKKYIYKKSLWRK